MVVSKVLYVLFFFVFIFVIDATGNDVEEQDNFYVKPGGVKHTHTAERDGYTCSFTYVAQGGTHESWLMQVGRQGERVVCGVERPQGTSYLFFQQFSMTLTGNGVTVDSFEAYANGGAFLGPNEVVLDEGEGTVASSDGHFKSQLAKVSVIGIGGNKKTKEDL